MTADPLSMTADQLVSTPFLFPKGVDVDSLYKQLMKTWHPDRSRDPLAGKIASRISEHYQLAKAGKYPNSLTVLTKKGPISLSYVAVRPTEFGELYVRNHEIVWALRPEFKDLAGHAVLVLKGLKYPHQTVKDKLAPFLPQNIRVLVNKDRTYVFMNRGPEFIRVVDILEKKGPFDPKHAAWITSRAYNLAGLFGYNKLFHFDISPETFFVEPSSHLGSLLGGWWYSGTKPLAAPARSSHLTKMPLARAHASQIKQLTRRCLGASNIAEVRKLTHVPKPMREWLLTGSDDSILDEEDKWKKVLVECFGPRKFTEFHLTAAEIYGSNKES